VRRRRPRRCPIATLAALGVVAALLSGCGSDPRGADPSSDRPTTTPLQYVAFGDSWPEGAHCGGCRSFAYLWADLIEEQTGRTVEVTTFMGAAEHSDTESKTSASLRVSLTTDETTRAAVRTADIILVATGPNALGAIVPRISAGRCGGPDDQECIRRLGTRWARDFDAILDEVTELRQGRPTVIRLVNAANGFLIDPGLAAAVPRGFAQVGGHLVFELLTRAQCSAARAHDAICVDVDPQITGPGGDSNENSTASMRAVAQALMKTGLAELGAAGQGQPPP
jgi:hypothetical protein